MAHLFSRQERAWPIPIEQPSEDERQSVLANVKRLRQEYLKATREFELLRVAQERNGSSTKHLSTLADAAKARTLALNRWLAAAAEAAGED